jgi:hypothetical protein
MSLRSFVCSSVRSFVRYTFFSFFPNKLSKLKQTSWMEVINISILSKPTKTHLKNHQHPLRLLGRCSGEPRSKTTSQEGRDLKFDTDLPWYILWISSMLKTTKTTLRNNQSPLRLLGWCSGEPSQEGRDLKLIHTFLDVYYGYSIKGVTAKTHIWKICNRNFTVQYHPIFKIHVSTPHNYPIIMGGRPRS